MSLLALGLNLNEITTFVFVHKGYYNICVLFRHTNRGTSNNLLLLVVALFTVKVKRLS